MNLEYRMSNSIQNHGQNMFKTFVKNACKMNVQAALLA
jgi:hypothetical protein